MNNIKTGVCSITFRQLSVRQIAELVKKAGLDAIEWGGDIHVPSGNLSAAKEVKKITEDAGLLVSSYGSYFRIVDKTGKLEEFAPVLDTAIELQTDTIRVWAGSLGSDSADTEYYKKVVDQSLLIAEKAGEHKVKIAFEFHRGTMTDTNEATIQLLKDADHPNLYTYWQPIYWGPDMDYRLRGLNALKSKILNLHVFHWLHDCETNQTDRRPLEEGTEKWKKYLSTEFAPGNHFALMEFVRDGSPEQFLADSKTIKSWF